MNMTDIHRCRRCKRPLKDEARIRDGIGYSCAKEEAREGMKNDIVIAEWLGWIQVECEDDDGGVHLEWQSPSSIANVLPRFSLNANLWFGPDGLLKKAGTTFWSTWVIASLRMDWEQGPRLWAKTLAEMIQDAG